jgi:capsular polysaccharide export protein
VLAWGRKPSAERAERWALQHHLPLLRLEDGFLRSVGLGPDEPPLSLVFDDLGIYYDASAPSRLEQLACRTLLESEVERARALRERWCGARVSKYNQGRELPTGFAPGDVLVVDQTAGDVSISGGLASAASFERMLEAALDEHPRGAVWIKVHPDVVAGRKQGHFDALTPAQRLRVKWLREAVHPVGLLERAAAVYTVTSQMGFEALLWGRPVRCFGMPFYAGWGLTGDELPASHRRQSLSLEALVHAALITYPRYLDPETRQLCAPERLLAWMGLQRRQIERFQSPLRAVGFSGWKRPLLRRFLAGSELRFCNARRALAGSDAVVVWGRQPWSGPPEQPVLRVEDGFLRSVGLGADLVRPLSWVIDARGLYYDASRPSELEHLLQHADFSPELLLRARRLRERLLASGLTKYNISGPTWRRPAEARRVVLVVGQVESDASIALGAPGLRTNMALLKAVQAELRLAGTQHWLIYKPHPDVAAGLRSTGEGEPDARAWCDEVLPHAPMAQLLEQVDEVHVLTSLAGFEALLRGVRVVVWGCPFYMGWGLTEDRLTLPRRSRTVSLDGLVAAALILYPTYVSQESGRFASVERALDELLFWRQYRPAVSGAAGLWRAIWRLLLRCVVSLRRSWG